MVIPPTEANITPVAEKPADIASVMTMIHVELLWFFTAYRALPLLTFQYFLVLIVRESIS